MITAIAYCHFDLVQIQRLLLWIQFLSHRKQGKLLLVASQIASRSFRHESIIRAALRVAQKVYLLELPKIQEEGWPKSPNLMFQQTLLHCEENFPDDDVLWIEPDAVPTSSAWLKPIEREVEEMRMAGRTFLGGTVSCSPPHMTGNGVYGAGWKKAAPSILTADSIPWDVHAGNEIWEAFMPTKLFQHCWTRESGHGITDLSFLRPETAVFHQCKTGALMRLLDKRDHNGKFFNNREDVIERVWCMPKYYTTDNATKPILSAGIQFKFEPLDCFGGSWRGIYATDNEQEIYGLNLLANDPGSAVREITEEEYDAKVKKKPLNTRSLTASSQAPSPPPTGLGLKEKAGVVVDNPVVEPKILPQSPEVLPSSIDEVITLGRVEPNPSAERAVRRKRKVIP